ncbi:hypothetical protein HOD83_03715 [Candidatus Woesearchaeota archaeon]|jgi:hypothetical protein|nr:hypothetical protein [Candidatus Woesearchaeota archaeon]MBT4114228.1 hypothetical protein [Candidatus Woesearchaeota archaeon]MBT4248660.1 hypothetical protein [Candidatus Woesearchaeota archaeon]
MKRTTHERDELFERLRSAPKHSVRQLKWRIFKSKVRTAMELPKTAAPFIGVGSAVGVLYYLTRLSDITNAQWVSSILAGGFVVNLGKILYDQKVTGDENKQDLRQEERERCEARKFELPEDLRLAVYFQQHPDRFTY